MSRAPLIAANWKMHKTVREADNFVDALLAGLGTAPRGDDREVLICPPFTALAAVHARLAKSNVRLGCQNVFWAEKGAYTGEISPSMAKDLGCHYVIVGHSERRGIFGENDEMCAKKVRAVLDWGMSPLLCVGESLDEREARHTQSKVAGQVRAALDDISQADAQRVVVAYEPIWAIGTGKNDTPREANQTAAFIRGVLAERVGESVARQIRILYGGSVKPENIDGFMAESDIDGALVGGASLEAVSFLRIVGYQSLGVTGR